MNQRKKMPAKATRCDATRKSAGSTLENSSRSDVGFPGAAIRSSVIAAAKRPANKTPVIPAARGVLSSRRLADAPSFIATPHRVRKATLLRSDRDRLTVADE
jgi:hypothetical protein